MREIVRIGSPPALMDRTPFLNSVPVIVEIQEVLGSVWRVNSRSQISITVPLIELIYSSIM